MLSDDDVINLVTLKFTADHYGYKPEEIIKMRSTGKGFVVINDEIKKGKKEHKVKEKDFDKKRGRGEEKGPEKEKHKGKGKDKDKD